MTKALFIFWGKVIHGKKRGKLLGYPTINMHLHKKIPEGIYASTFKLCHSGKSKRSKDASRIATGFWISQDDRRKYISPSVTFIGAAKTFNEKDVKAETYILDFDKNIYGKWITIQLYKKLRGNKKFNSEKELIIQMKKDIDDAKTFF